MDAEVEARVRNRRRERVEDRRPARVEERQRSRAGERRRRVPRRKRMTVWNRDERIRFVRPLLPDRGLDDPRETVGDEHGGGDHDEHPRVAQQQCDADCEDEPDDSVRPDLREPDEDVVQRRPSVVDDPPLGVPIPAGQTGTIVFVWSISCCRSNGLPMNPCAPPALACCSASSSTFPLNMTTGIAPAP